MKCRRLRGVSRALVVLAAAFGCGSGDYRFDTRRGDAPRPHAKRWTSFDLYEALLTGAPVAVSPSFPRGFEATVFLALADDGAQLNIRAGFSEGQPSAFVVPELWVDYDEVWVQPWYLLVTAWDEKSPQQNRLKEADGTTNSPPVFDVGYESPFYSPLWTVFYAVVRPGAA